MRVDTCGIDLRWAMGLAAGVVRVCRVHTETSRYGYRGLGRLGQPDDVLAELSHFLFLSLSLSIDRSEQGCPLAVGEGCVPAWRALASGGGSETKKKKRGCRTLGEGEEKGNNVRLGGCDSVMDARAGGEPILFYFAQPKPVSRFWPRACFYSTLANGGIVVDRGVSAGNGLRH